MRLDCGVSRDGSKMKNVYLAGVHYGLEAHGYKMEIEGLKKNAVFPCIIHWEFNHFVVLDGFRGDKAVINDPARGKVTVSMEQFDRSFTGLCLTFAPSESFTPSGKRKSTMSYAFSRLRGAGPAAAFVILTSVIASLFGIINPTMSRLFYDRLLTRRAPEWLIPFIIAMAALAAFQLIVEWIKTVYSLKINGKMAIEGNASFMWKVLHLPMTFFSQRMSGDILQRKQTNASIAGTLVNTVAPLALNTVMMVFYLIVMLRYSAVMTAVGLGSLILNLLVARYLSSKRVNLKRVQLRDSGKLASATLTGISMTETIKASGAEAGFFRKWSGYQASVTTQKVKFFTLSTRIGLIPQIISTVSNYAVLFLGVHLAMEGSFTLGMITTFQGLLSSFMNPAVTLISAGQTIQEMRTEMERIEDVMNYPDDPIMQRESPVQAEKSYNKLKGELRITGLTFGYSRLAEPVICDFSMHIKPGQRIAIVGASGCGKSTVSKLITGLYEPWEGELLFDERPAADIDRSVFTGSVAMVDQDIVLFEDTIANNIKMWDDTITDYEMILAARDAQIHDDILKRPGGYQGKLIENGKDLSGGQRQRLEIARVLAQEPTLIIMDEATSALDNKTQRQVSEALDGLHCTRIVIAHRLSTIRNCDRILVMDNGGIAEEGSYEELIRKNGYFAELVDRQRLDKC